MINRDIKILDSLQQRTEDLPEILHLRAADVGYQLTDEDKSLLFDTYSKLDDILKEVAAFINIKFPGCERHIKAWNDIDFDTKIGGIKIITNDREHTKREWRKGMFDLKSLIKMLRNEAVLIVDNDDDHFIEKNLKDISSDYSLEHYNDEKIIPNQNLVNDTISFFVSEHGKGAFTPLQFLNLLDKQYSFVKLNYNNGERVIQHLKNLQLSDRIKHTLYGFILKWFGGYPVNNFDEDFDRTLKLVQKEFLNFEGDTPEKQYCKADQTMRNRFEKYGIAFTTAINHGIDVNEILTAMGDDEPKQKMFYNFSDLFTSLVNDGIVRSYNNSKEYLIAQSFYNYEFNVWLQTHKDWEYRNEEQYEKMLTKEIFLEFLTQHKSAKYNSSSSIKFVTDILKVEEVNAMQPTIRQVALICHYTDRTVTRESAKAIVKEYDHASGDALFNLYSYYRSKSNRIGTENTKKKNDNKIKLFESILNWFENNEVAKSKVGVDLLILREAVEKENLNL
ncbi:hypothetical protein [Pedobacter cryoconitis]|uniref:hypothetical protein n=1 Tax=Pedobacter cryoconitis TaxID=188932 RepID=UPI00161A3400|nr:hypothetical protein [Pedobacter cryoconitis]MBB5645982.1 hypothetical protein [Pedobacter cryoconitis]